MPTVSTIIPFKNVREYIEESLNSIISQSLTNREIILVDDGSTDGSGAFAKALSEQYDWIRYTTTDHRWPGGARNAGISIAKGDYINFADADDIVPGYTYEKMYNEAVRCDADCVIGKAVRLDDSVGKMRASSLHQKVYFQYHHKTNIREYTNLVYDTTVWNKMIKRDFWQRNNISFPELTPYQDIPATFQMHYCAKEIVMMDEVVYIWRVRTGDNKSITQQKAKLDNLQARLNMISLVDNYCADHVKEERLQKAKRIKWLDVDLKNFMNESLSMDDATALKMMGKIRDYIVSTGLTETISEMPVLVAEQYNALLKSDLNRLRQLRLFEQHDFGQIPSFRSFRKTKGQFPSEIVSKKQSDLTTTIDMELLTQRIIKISEESQGILIRGYAFLKHQPVNKANTVRMDAFIIKTNGECVRKIMISQNKSSFASKKGMDSDGNALVDYSWAGYTLLIDSETIESLETGSYHVRIKWDSYGQHRDTTLRGFRKSYAESFSGNHIVLKTGKAVEISSTLLNELEIKIIEC